MRHGSTARCVILGAVVGVLCVMVTACGDSGSSTESTSSSGSGTSSQPGAGKNVGLVITGFINDHASGESAHNGLVAAEKAYGVKGNAIDNVPDPEAQERAVQALAQSNDFVIGISTGLTPFFVAAANQNPDKEFVLGNAQIPDAPKNLYWLQPDWNQFGYMAGTIAAKLSKSKTVGFIGGAVAPTITAGRDGFKRGATETDGNVKVLSTITGSFTDPAKTRSAAESQIASGADVLWLETDSAYSGAVQAAKAADHKVLLIGSVAPHCDDSAGLDVGDTIVDWTTGVKGAVGQWLDDSLKSIPFGFDGKLGIFESCDTPYKAQVDKIVKDTTAKISDGTISFPKAN